MLLKNLKSLNTRICRHAVTVLHYNVFNLKYNVV